ncbi:MAG TPA: copper resistance protein CopC [Candidatus Dormibacteraeota bacterium]|nr:copper resistance protein CopC [Candidatus Dormibacteraeota bacterium]
MQSDPAPDARLQSLPPTVTLLFTEPVTPAGPGLRVYAPSGAQVAGTLSVHGSALTAPISTTEQGTFVVSWQVFAADTHPSRGAFAFSVGAPTANPYATLLSTGEVGTSTPLGLALQALAHWIHFAGFALVFGVAGYRVLTRSPGFGRLLGAGVLLLVVAEPLAVVAQLASLSFDGDTAVAVLGSGFGRLVGLRLGAALLAWTVLATGRSWPLLAIGAADAVIDGLGAHAIPGLPGLGQALAAVHVGAMGLWVGGLAAYVTRPDSRFARYALVTFATATATGAVLALAHTVQLSALIATDYGRALILKVAIVALVATSVLIRRRRLELIGTFAIIGAAALVAALPPSR